LKNTVFKDVTPCSLIEIYHFLLAVCLPALVFKPEDGDTVFFQNIGKLLRIYDACLLGGGVRLVFVMKSVNFKLISCKT
jgi:hypothetical protein